MVPNRTIPIASVVPTRHRGPRPPAEARSVVRRLLVSLGSRQRQSRRTEDAAFDRRLDRAMDLIEHETCDCV